MENALSVDIIIPCYNEEKILGTTIGKLTEKFNAFPYAYNILMVDNGSTDHSVAVAQKYRVRVSIQKQGTIAELRNHGAAQLNGDYLIFLDADVLITDQWYKELLVFLKNNKAEKIITGAPYGIVSKPSKLEKCWYAGKRFSQNYINSGNLILPRKLFEELGGFDATLKTGEDYDLCVRAQNKGSRIWLNPEFKTIHFGYPKNLIAFFNKEIWHGAGDFKTLKSVLSSKPALLSIVNVIFLFFTLISVIFFSNILLSLPYFLFIISIISIMSIKKSKGLSCFIYNLAASTLYLYARFGSIFKR